MLPIKKIPIIKYDGTQRSLIVYIIAVIIIITHLSISTCCAIESTINICTNVHLSFALRNVLRMRLVDALERPRLAGAEARAFRLLKTK